MNQIQKLIASEIVTHRELAQIYRDELMHARWVDDYKKEADLNSRISAEEKIDQVLSRLLKAVSELGAS